MKRDKHDKVTSFLVRTRSNWTCERCMKYYPEGHRGGLENSHYISRGKMSTRYSPDNCSAFCTGCHFHMSANREAEYTPWLRKQLGEDRFDDLVRRGHAVMRYTKDEKEKRYQHYKEELADMQLSRDMGETDWIEFTSWD